MSSNTYRLNLRDRESRHQARSKIEGVGRQAELQRQDRLLRFKGLLAGVFLFPLGLITAITFGEMLWRALSRTPFWKSEELVFFLVGGVAWLATYLAGCRPVRTYVLGHELSHLVVARAFGGRILGFKVTAQGGYVETNKTNTWITLAPYLLPFYSVVVLVLFGLAGILWNLHELRALPIPGVATHFKPVWFFYAALGLTWWFHATFTFKTVMACQSDLEHNGEFFSMLLIFLINVLLLVALFLAASPAPGLGWLEVGRCWMATARGVWNFCAGAFF